MKSYQLSAVGYQYFGSIAYKYNKPINPQMLAEKTPSSGMINEFHKPINS